MGKDEGEILFVSDLKNKNRSLSQEKKMDAPIFVFSYCRRSELRIAHSNQSVYAMLY